MPSRPSGIIDLVSLVLDRPAPVLLLDTCAIFDILRSLYRESATIQLVRMARHASLVSSASPPGLHIVMSEQGQLELAKNLPEALAELKTRVNHLVEMGLTFLADGESGQFRESLRVIEDGLVHLAHQLTGCSSIIANSMLSTVAANQRLAKAIAPGRAGSSNVGDCLIVEHFLEVVQELRARGFDQQCIFISSNYRDFGKAPNPKPPLDSQFALLSIDYMVDFAAALDQIGI